MFFWGQNLTSRVGCDQGRTGKENEKNDFKPVGFNQASARVLGDKPVWFKKTALAVLLHTRLSNRSTVCALKGDTSRNI